MFRLIVSNGVEESITEDDSCELEAWYEALVLWSEHLEENCEEVDNMYEVRYAIEVYRKKLGLMTEDEMFPGWEECDHSQSELELINNTRRVLEDMNLTCTLFDD